MDKKLNIKIKMSLEQNNSKKHQNGMIKSNKIYKGNINEVVNYMNSVRI